MKTKTTIIVPSVILAAVLGAFLPHPARGVIVLSNLGEPTSFSNFVKSDTWYANGFTTSANPGGWNLLSATLDMAAAVNSSGNFFVSIYDTGGQDGTPGSLLAALSGSANPATAGQYTYSAGTGLSLAASTSYWLVAGVSSGSGFYEWNTVGNRTETGDWSFPANDLAMRLLNFSPDWTLAAAGYVYKFSLEAEPVGGAPVPEPGTWASAALLAGVGACVRLRRRSKESL